MWMTTVDYVYTTLCVASVAAGAAVFLYDLASERALKRRLAKK